MKRKVIQIANSTQLISLPRQWAKKFDIKKGIELDVNEQGDKIIIGATSNPQIKKADLELSGIDPLTLRLVGALYKSGYDQINVEFDDARSVKELHDKMNDLLPGYEVLQHTPNTLMIRDIAHDIGGEFNAVLRRAFIVTKSLATNTYDILEKFDESQLKNIFSLEMTNNRLCNYCERVLNKKGFEKFDKTSFIYVIVWELEKIADQYKYLAYYLKDHKNIKVSKETKDIFKEANEMFNLFYETFYKFDRENVARLAELRKEIIKKALAFMEKKKNSEIRIIHHVINIVQMTFNLLGCYLGSYF